MQNIKKGAAAVRRNDAEEERHLHAAALMNGRLESLYSQGSLAGLIPECPFLSSKINSSDFLRRRRLF